VFDVSTAATSSNSFTVDGAGVTFCNEFATGGFFQYVPTSGTPFGDKNFGSLNPENDLGTDCPDY
jgi:hypothetical protein